MNDEIVNSVPANIENAEQEIDWAGYVAKLWKCRKFIILWTVVFMILGVVYALRMKRQYSTSVTLAPELTVKSGSSSIRGMLSSLGMGGGLGSMAGDGSEALNFSLFPEMLSSSPFITELFDIKVKPYVSKKDLEKGKPEKPATTLFRYILKKDEPKGFVAQIFESIFGPVEEDTTAVNPKRLNNEQDRVVKYLRKSINADVDKKTAITTISVTMDDPVMVAQVADTVCARLQRKIYEYRTQKAANDLAYYTKLSDEAKEKMIKAQTAYAASVDYDRSVILQSVSSEKERLQQEASFSVQIYQQMEQQKEMAKAKFQEAKPVFAVVQPATVPLTASNSRKKVVLIFMFLGFVGSAAWKLFGADFIRDFLANAKTKMKEDKAATEQS